MKRCSSLIKRFLHMDKKHPDLRIKGMLGTAPGKLGPGSVARVFNRSPTATCCARDADGNTIASRACRPVCYAWGKMRQYHGALQRQADRNDRIVQLDEFPDLVIAAIRCCRTRCLRIHSTGDFDTERYVLAWLQVATACQDVEFLAYTRSYRRQALVPALTRLAAVPNVHLLLSCDWDTGKPPPIPQTELAYMQTREDDMPSYPVRVVFRSSQERAPARVVRPHKSRVCPHEDGTTAKPPPCVTCRHCFFKERPVGVASRHKATTMPAA